MNDRVRRVKSIENSFACRFKVVSGLLTDGSIWPRGKRLLSGPVNDLDNTVKVPGGLADIIEEMT